MMPTQAISNRLPHQKPLPTAPTQGHHNTREVEAECAKETTGHGASPESPPKFSGRKRPTSIHRTVLPPHPHPLPPITPTIERPKPRTTLISALCGLGITKRDHGSPELGSGWSALQTRFCHEETVRPRLTIASRKKDLAKVDFAGTRKIQPQAS
jgi:hypothetical protein